MEGIHTFHMENIIPLTVTCLVMAVGKMYASDRCIPFS